MHFYYQTLKHPWPVLNSTCDSFYGWTSIFTRLFFVIPKPILLMLFYESKLRDSACHGLNRGGQAHSRSFLLSRVIWLLYCNMSALFFLNRKDYVLLSECFLEAGYSMHYDEVLGSFLSFFCFACSHKWLENCFFGIGALWKHSIKIYLNDALFGNFIVLWQVGFQ